MSNAEVITAREVVNVMVKDIREHLSQAGITARQLSAYVQKKEMETKTARRQKVYDVFDVADHLAWSTTHAFATMYELLNCIDHNAKATVELLKLNGDIPSVYESRGPIILQLK